MITAIRRRYCNPRLHALETAGRATYDTSARLHYHADIQRILEADQPVIFLSWPIAGLGFNPSLKHVLEPDGTLNVRMDQWSL